MSGATPLSVTAVTQQIKPDIYPKVDDEATIIVTYPHAQGIIQASWNWPFNRKDVEVYTEVGGVWTLCTGNAAGANKIRVKITANLTDGTSPALSGINVVYTPA